MRNRNEQGGYTALITVMIVGALGLSISLALIFAGLGASKSSFALEQSNQAKALANACAENALQNIHDLKASGSNSINLALGSCSYIIINSNPGNYLISAEGIVGKVVRKVAISIDSINPAININSWTEVENFQ